MCARPTTAAMAIYITGHMALSWKLVIDSTNAPAQADFWAAALEYEVEDPSALISNCWPPAASARMPSSSIAAARPSAATPRSATPRTPYDETSGIGRGRRLLFQEVPERKSGKNRLHIDVHGEPGGLDKLVARLEELGATRVREVDKGPAGHWWIMQDPEGNEFCAA